ncbi:acidic mammalian chitinase-like [Ctenopharyngodon idella]|uniref:acidic mammalian chitinase-like n=1 Tax=Ctenopharyngodon idella TaxID=7959 RepID=UPI00222F2F7F|nr:acidic mammalian chitinase-like [Ctenopharyngodon idella]
MSNKDARLILTATVSAQKEVIERSYNIPEISKYLDFISVKTFDFHTFKDGIARHHSPLYSAVHDEENINSNTDFALQYWRFQGAPAEKLLMGFATYGRSFILTSSQNGVGAPANNFASPGPYTQEMGLWSYFEICLFIRGGIVQWIEDQNVPFSIKGSDWVGFDNLRSFEIKIKYLQEHSFGGAFVWALDLDDFSGSFCGQGNYPLVNNLKKLLILGELIGVEYLYQQTGNILQDYKLAIEELETTEVVIEEDEGYAELEEFQDITIPTFDTERTPAASSQASVSAASAASSPTPPATSPMSLLSVVPPSPE